MDHLEKVLKKQGLETLWRKSYIHPILKDMVVIPGEGRRDIERHAKFIIVDVRCGMSVLRGADIYAPGVIGVPAGIRKGDRVSVFADLKGKFLQGCKPSQEDLRPEEVFHVGNGVSHVSRWDLFSSKGKERAAGRKGPKIGEEQEEGGLSSEEEERREVAISMDDKLFVSPSLQRDLAPHLFPQNLPSAAVAHILDPQPGETVLDMCAAPGGKTTHLASLMKGKGKLVALDVVEGRVQKLKENLEKYQARNVEVLRLDAATLFPIPNLGYPGGPFPKGSFDRILLDAPCSALGQRPLLSSTLSLTRLSAFSTYQKTLVESAAYLLKPKGGTLVYSTCTINPEENEMVVAWILSSFPHLRLVSQAPFVLGSPGGEQFGLTEEQRRLVQVFDPCSDLDTIGFFIAKFESTHSE